MRELHNVPILPANLLNHYGPEHDTFRPDEAVELLVYDHDRALVRTLV